MVIGSSRPSVSTDECIEVISPLTGGVLATVADASRDQAAEAISVAQNVFDTTWYRVSGTARSQLLHRFAELVDEHADELGRLDTQDNGKLLRETASQAHFAARNYRFFAGLADKLGGRTIPLDSYDTFDYTVAEPVGVAVLITAWNSPQQLLANKLAPALAAGCTVVVKPSELAPRSTIRIAELALDAGFPPGVVNVVTGGGEAGAALTSDPRAGRISFTGSVQIGRTIASSAAENLVPVTLELGGKSANIVFDDANLELALPGVVAGIFAAGGQTCIAGSRVLVQETVYDEFVGRVAERARQIRLGDPSDPTTQMGPVANRPQFDRIASMIETTTSTGAPPLTGGGLSPVAQFPNGLFVQPTVFDRVDPSSALAQTEVFGPVLAAIPFRDEEEAVSIANGTDFGLASGLWTQKVSRVHRMARRLAAGTVWVNTYRFAAPQAPFGGMKKSGYGRERSTEAIHDYLHTKNVLVNLTEEPSDPFVIRN